MTEIKVNWKDGSSGCERIVRAHIHEPVRLASEDIKGAVKGCSHASDIAALKETNVIPIRKRSPNRGLRSTNRRGISFSATLPYDVLGVVAEGIALVKYSWDPFSDFRSSMVEMITELHITDWFDLEELLYCYLSLNSSDSYCFIEDAFKSLLISS